MCTISSVCLDLYFIIKTREHLITSDKLSSPIVSCDHHGDEDFAENIIFFIILFFSKKFSNTIAITRNFYKKHKLYKNCKRLYIFKKSQKNKKICEKAKNFAKFAKKYKVQKNTLSGRGLFSSIFFSFIERRPSWRKKIGRASCRERVLMPV